MRPWRPGLLVLKSSQRRRGKGRHALPVVKRLSRTLPLWGNSGTGHDDAPKLCNRGDRRDDRGSSDDHNPGVLARRPGRGRAQRRIERHPAGTASPATQPAGRAPGRRAANGGDAAGYQPRAAGQLARRQHSAGLEPRPENGLARRQQAAGLEQALTGKSAPHPPSPALREGWRAHGDACFRQKIVI
jgi:hypothetical protein